MGGPDSTLVSADWRFLDQIPRRGRALVLGPEIPQLEDVFDTTYVARGALPESSFDLAVLIDASSAEDLRLAARSTSGTNGVVITGIGEPDADRTLGLSVIPGLRRLTRAAGRSGLEVVAVYGALPNPWNPEYLYPMGGPAARFAIERFIQSRRPTGPLGRAIRRLPDSLVTTAFTTGALAILRHAGTAGASE